jgi:hypothetical protein
VHTNSGHSFYRISTLIHESPRTLLLESTLLAEAADGLRIQQTLHEWYSKFQSRLPTISPDHPEVIAEVYYHTTLIMLSDIFDYQHEWDQYTVSKLSVPEVQTHLEAILDLIEAGLKTNLTGMLFFLPLRVAGAQGTQGEDSSYAAGDIEERISSCGCASA